MAEVRLVGLEGKDAKRSDKQVAGTSPSELPLTSRSTHIMLIDALISGSVLTLTCPTFSSMGVEKDSSTAKE